MKQIQNQQRLLFGAIVAVLGGVMGVVLYLIVLPSSPESSASIKKDPFVTGTSRLKPQEVWVHKMTAEAELTNKRLEALEDRFSKMITLLQGTLTEQLKADIMPSIKDAGVEPGVSSPNEPLPALPAPTLPKFDTPVYQQEHKALAPAQGYLGKLQKISLSLRNPKSSRSMKTIDNTIPAGAFAEAILLGGVDASTSIQAASDPRPVLLKLVDMGTLPRKFHSDLKGCHVLAATYGDIASERVFMRLEKLTCIERQTGEILELNVQGYVAGEDGRAGVRGTVVDRTGDSMRNALLGGFVSGMGQYLSQSHNPVTFSPVGGLAQTNPLNVTQAMQHGAAKGASSALERYADFYIKRAEQMQPVLQIAAGRKVDIVFTQGVAMDGSALRNALVNINDQQRQQTIRNLDQEAAHKENP